MATYVGNFRSTANDILNQVGVEIGLDPSTDPFSSADATYRQMIYLLNTAGKELSYLHPWQIMTLTDYIDTTTPVNDVGNSAYYDLPADILYTHNGTGWNSVRSTPLIGPATPQEWAYLMYGGTIRAGDYAYQIKNDYLHLSPDPAGAQLDVYLTYQSRNWVQSSEDPKIRLSECRAGADTPYLDSLLLSRMLKVKILEARGFDTSKAQADFNQIFELCTGKDKGAPTLNAGRGRIDPYYLKTPDTGYGS